MTRDQWRAERANRHRLDRALRTASDPTAPARVRKEASRRAASFAEKLGLIGRPARCQWCRMRLPLERHHVDHAEPLAILFLCRGCHEVADRMATGATA